MQVVRQAFLEHQPFSDRRSFQVVRAVIVAVFVAIVAWILWAPR